MILKRNKKKPSFENPIILAVQTEVLIKTFYPEFEEVIRRNIELAGQPHKKEQRYVKCPEN